MTHLQEQIEGIAPQGWTLGLENFSLGDVAPSISGFQVFNNSTTGEVESMTADVLLETTTLQVSITGSGPLVGKFVGVLLSPHKLPPCHWPSVQRATCSIHACCSMVSATDGLLHVAQLLTRTLTAHTTCRSSAHLRTASVARAVNLKGLTLRGKLRFVPFAQQRLLLWAFAGKPELDLKLNIRGRFIGQQSIPQFAFLRSAIIAALQKDFVEPNRGAIPFEFAPLQVRRHVSHDGRMQASQEKTRA